jgi:hypothetical protein
MKSKFILTAFALCIVMTCAAQWTPSSPYSGPIHYMGGNVGIGTEYPLRAKLQIVTTQTTDYAVRLDTGKFSMSASSRFEIDAPGVFGGRVQLLEDGRMGIGSTSPQSRLHVHETAPLGTGTDRKLLMTVSGSVTSNGMANSVWLVRENSSTTDWTTARLHDAISVDGSFWTPGMDTKTWWERDPYDNIQSWGNGNQTYMTLKNGALGLGGVTNPDATLTVKGDIHTNEVRIDVDAPIVPDYVFEKEYSLLPLSELEAYIRANKHLPEVPTAKEMAATGLDVKQMNLLLLKKVEELTLHVIELKKQNDEMNERLCKIEQ